MSDDLMNRTVKEIDILRKQVTQLKKIIENKNIMITKLREELSEVTQDRSNERLSWAEIDDRR